MVPHPFHAIRRLEQRNADYLAESANEQRARLVEGTAHSSSRLRWADFVATLVALAVLALLLATGVEALLTLATAAPLAGVVLS